MAAAALASPSLVAQIALSLCVFGREVGFREVARECVCIKRRREGNNTHVRHTKHAHAHKHTHTHTHTHTRTRTRTLTLTISHTQEDDPSIYVTGLVPGGAAEQHGRIFTGDKIVSINGESCEDKPHHDAVQLLRSSDTLQIVVAHNAMQRRQAKSQREKSPVAIGVIEIDLHRVCDGRHIACGASILCLHVPVWGHTHAHMLTYAHAHSLIHTCTYTPTHLLLSLCQVNGGLGFTIAGGKGTPHVAGDNGVFITKISEGGAADADGRLAVGDKVVSVAGVDVRNWTHDVRAAERLLPCFLQTLSACVCVCVLCLVCLCSCCLPMAVTHACLPCFSLATQDVVQQLQSSGDVVYLVVEKNAYNKAAEGLSQSLGFSENPPAKVEQHNNTQQRN